MGINIYEDVKNVDSSAFHRRDHDGTEGGDLIQQNSVAVNTELSLVSDTEFRHITETDGVLVVQARVTHETQQQVDDAASVRIKAAVQVQSVGEEAAGSFGFGFGDFGQGGFGGTLP